VPLPTIQLPHHIPQKPIWSFTLWKAPTFSFFFISHFLQACEIPLTAVILWSGLEEKARKKLVIDEWLIVNGGQGHNIN
jgi:hypothetical protein